MWCFHLLQVPAGQPPGLLLAMVVKLLSDSNSCCVRSLHCVHPLHLIELWHFAGGLKKRGSIGEQPELLLSSDKIGKAGKVLCLLTAENDKDTFLIDFPHAEHASVLLVTTFFIICYLVEPVYKYITEDSIVYISNIFPVWM